MAVSLGFDLKFQGGGCLFAVCLKVSGEGGGVSLGCGGNKIVLTAAGLPLLCGLGVRVGVLLNAVDKQADRLPDSKTDGSKTERLPDLKTDRLVDSKPGSLT